MEKSEFLQTRVSAKLKLDFNNICKTLDRQPTAQVRELVEEFVRKNFEQLGAPLVVNIWQPIDYDTGAWRVTMSLRDSSLMEWHEAFMPFEMPTLSMRSVRSDPEYRAVLKIDGNTVLGGRFKDSEWRGHIYTNGIAEEENPTPIDEVKGALFSIVNDIITRMKD